MAVDLAQILLLALKILLGFLHNDRHQAKADDRSDNRCNGHDPIRLEHHDDGPDEQREGSDQRADALIHSLPDRIHIIGHPGQNIAGRRFIVVRYRQSVHFV
ncbi:hypothetical protein D3C71_1655590 [compost metagenome]